MNSANLAWDRGATSFWIECVREAAASVNWRALAAMILLLAPVSFYNYLLFHTLAELFSIIVAISAFAVAWRAYPFTRNDFLMFLGIGLFWVGGLDLVHTLLYKGMGVYPGTDANHPTQVWIATRYVQAAAMLAAPLFLSRSLNRLQVFVVFGAVAAVIYVAVIEGYFPDAFIEGQGLTPFKITSEYAIIGLLAAALGLLWSQRSLLDDRILILITASLAATMLAELAFTFYVSVYGLSNLVGHLLKLVAYWLLYCALVNFALSQPFRAMARAASTYDVVPEAIAVVDRDGIVRQVNRTAARAVGMAAPDCLGRHCHELFHPRDLARSACPVCSGIERGRSAGSLELEFGPGGRWHEFTLSPIAWSDAPAGMVHVRRDVTERRLRERQSRLLAAIIGSTDDAVVGKDLDGVIVSWNAGAERTYGYPAKEAIGRSASMLASPDRPDETFAILDRIRRGERVVHYETTRRRKDGTAIHVSLTVSPIRDETGAITGASAIARDITERKVAEEALRTSAAEIEDLYNNAPCGYHSLDRDGHFVRINDTELSWLGYTRGELTGKLRFPDLLTPQSRQVFHDNFPRFIECGVVRDLEFEVVRKDGSILPIALSATAVKDGAGHYLMSRSTLHDITESRRAMELLRRSEERFRGLVETTSDWIWEVRSNHGFIYTYASPKVTDILGYATAEVVGRSPFDFMPPDEATRVHTIFAETVRQQRSFEVLENVNLHKDGRRVILETSGVPFFDEDGGLLGYRGVDRDITERKKAEVDLLRLNRTLRTISACNEALVRATDENRLLAEMCRIIVETGGYRMAWVGYAGHDAGKFVHPAAKHGYETEYLGSAKITWDESDRGEGPTGRAIRTAAVQIVEDCRIDPHFAPWRTEAGRRGYRSAASLPLATSLGKVIGALTIYAAESGAFTEEAVTLLRELANDLAYGIEALRTRERHRQSEQIIRESEERHRSIFEHARDVIYTIGADLKFVSLSPSFARITGWRPEDWIGKPFLPIVHPDDQSRALQILDKTLSEQVSSFFEMRIAKKSGEYWIGEFSAGPLHRSGSTVLFGIGRDVTERSILAEKVARLTRIHAVLSGINSTIVRVRDRQELFNEACRICVEHGNFGIAWIGAFDRATLDVTPIAWAGIEAEEVARSRGTARSDVAQGRGVVGRALRDRETAFDNDIAASPGAGGARRQEAVRRHYRSLAALPLFTEGDVVGHLSLFAKEPDFFDEEELRLLKELAADISFALDHLAKEEKVNYLALYDLLTGLPNRALLAERLTQHLQQAWRGNKTVALMLVDVQRFRNINDTLGRHAGDHLIKLIAERMTQALANKAGLARVEADRFALILGDVAGAAEAAHFIEREIDNCFDQPFRVEGQEFRISTRLGIALLPADGDSADALYRNAEAALLKAKARAEHFLFYAPEMNASVAESLNLENRLRKAIDEQQFVMYYQPKINSKTGAIVGLEALIRWNDPGRGLVAPAKFVPILEETGLILPVGDWAMRQAVRDYRAWVEKGLCAPRVAVNVSVIQLRQKSFVPTVQEAIGPAVDGTHGLDLEITESLIMANVEENIVKLSALKETGMRIAVDDFGTGYSSLRYIARLPLDTLKIDRSFIAGMSLNPDDTTIVQTIIALGHDLGLKVIAEGVDSAEQANLLRLLKCDEMQGYLFGKPVPASEIDALIGMQGEGGKG